MGQRGVRQQEWHRVWLGHTFSRLRDFLCCTRSACTSLFPALPSLLVLRGALPFADPSLHPSSTPPITPSYISDAAAVLHSFSATPHSLVSACASKLPAATPQSLHLPLRAPEPSKTVSRLLGVERRRFCGEPELPDWRPPSSMAGKPGCNPAAYNTIISKLRGIALRVAGPQTSYQKGSCVIHQWVRWNVHTKGTCIKAVSDHVSLAAT